MLEEWNTLLRLKVINEAKHPTQSADLCRVQKAAEKLTANDDTSKQISMVDFEYYQQIL